MIDVSTEFVTNTAKSSRPVRGKVEIDWNLDGVFFDESLSTLIIEVERKVNIPLGGICIGMADVELENTDDRFTPRIT